MTDYYLPIGANIEGLRVEKGFGELIIYVPSRSIYGRIHKVTIDNSTRLMLCSCEGFKYHIEERCHHIRALLFLFHKRKGKKKKGVQATSIESYYKLSNNDFNENQIKIYNFICGHPDSSDRQIEEGTGLRCNVVTARRFELENKLFVIKESCKIWNEKTKREVSAYKVIEGVYLEGVYMVTVLLSIKDQRMNNLEIEEIVNRIKELWKIHLF